VRGLGLVNIEAMAMGRPVISTWAGGIPEVVVHGGTGLLVPPKMPGALAMAMMFLLQYPEIAKQLGMAASERAHSHFSAAATTSSTLRVYREALEHDQNPALAGSDTYVGLVVGTLIVSTGATWAQQNTSRVSLVLLCIDGLTLSDVTSGLVPQVETVFVQGACAPLK